MVKPDRSLSSRIVTAYFLSHGHWTVIPHQLAANFKEMRDCGFTAVAASVCESEMRYSRRALEIQVNLAHQCGLQYFVIPSRIGGRFAGAPLAPSLWLSQNPKSQIPGFENFSGPLACLENEPFQNWCKEFMADIVRDYPIDGVIWDEPKFPDVISRHPDTLAKFGDNPRPKQMESSFIEFIQDLTEHCLSINFELTITLMKHYTSSEHFTLGATAIPSIDYAGFDGPLCRQSFFHEPSEWKKNRIDTAWKRTINECKATGTRTYGLVENVLIPRDAMTEYEENLNGYLQNCRPDHLALYFYGHNNEDPEGVHAITRRLMQKYL